MEKAISIERFHVTCTSKPTAKIGGQKNMLNTFGRKNSFLGNKERPTMKISSIFAFFTFAAALVFARSFRGRSFGGRSTTNFGRLSSFGGRNSPGSFGEKATGPSKESKSLKGDSEKEDHVPGVSGTVVGGPCNDEDACDGEHNVCIDHLNTKLCFAQRDEGETCSGTFESCKKGVCRIQGFRKICMPDDNMAATGEICDSTRTCLDKDDVCKPCAWKFDEKRCVKMVKEGEECDLFEMCEAPGVCEKSPDKKKATCVPCPQVCPACHIPNDTCNGCVLDPNAERNCDPCVFDANGQNGHAVCAKLTGDAKYKCCSPTSGCVRRISEFALPSTVEWTPGTLMCSDGLSELSQAE